MSKQCQMCEVWIQDKEVELIQEFYRAKMIRRGRLYTFTYDMIKKTFLCSTCLFKHYRSTWEAYVTWLYATKQRRGVGLKKSKFRTAWEKVTDK